jgi:hypothetical protein
MSINFRGGGGMTMLNGNIYIFSALGITLPFLSSKISQTFMSVCLKFNFLTDPVFTALSRKIFKNAPEREKYGNLQFDLLSLIFGRIKGI